jgi:hypothetical protein
MFGLNTISQHPFATLETITPKFALFTFENTNANDASTQQSAFLLNLSENTNANDERSILFNALVVIAENTNPADSNAQQSEFLQAIVENIILNDPPIIARGWIKINNTQG